MIKMLKTILKQTKGYRIASVLSPLLILVEAQEQIYCWLMSLEW